MAYTGRPLANFFTRSPLASVQLLRSNLDALPIRRADGEPLDMVELDAALAEVGRQLERARDALSDYVMGPRFEVGQRVNLVSKDATKIVKRGLRVHEIRQEDDLDDLIEVVDVDGRHETYLSAELVDAGERWPP